MLQYILWYATFGIPTFWCGVTCVFRNCESHNLTSPFLTRGTRFLRGIENQITQHRLYFAPSRNRIEVGSMTNKFAVKMNPRRIFCGKEQRCCSEVVKIIWKIVCSYFLFKEKSNCVK